MPGTYLAGASVVTIAAFAKQLTVITSKQRPRKLTIHGSDGAEYMFLLKVAHLLLHLPPYTPLGISFLLQMAYLCEAGSCPPLGVPFIWCSFDEIPAPCSSLHPHDELSLGCVFIAMVHPSAIMKCPVMTDITLTSDFAGYVNDKANLQIRTT